MPLQNRVTPEGDIVATPARGTMFGNRGGCFHRDTQTLLPRPYASKQWICCVLAFKGRRRKLMQPGLYTELFFLDEATAFAAGHRPCFECRRDDAIRFAELWNQSDGKPGRAAAPAMDEVLHPQRIDSNRGKVRYQARVSELPNGAMVQYADRAHLIRGGKLLPWSFNGYDAARKVPPATTVDVLTPRQTVAILVLGFAPLLHFSADAAVGTDHNSSIVGSDRT